MGDQPSKMIQTEQNPSIEKEPAKPINQISPQFPISREFEKFEIEATTPTPES
jgi:hypothetical protein